MNAMLTNIHSLNKNLQFIIRQITHTFILLFIQLFNALKRSNFSLITFNHTSKQLLIFSFLFLVFQHPQFPNLHLYFSFSEQQWLVCILGRAWCKHIDEEHAVNILVDFLILIEISQNQNSICMRNSFTDKSIVKLIVCFHIKITRLPLHVVSFSLKFARTIRIDTTKSIVRQDLSLLPTRLGKCTFKQSSFLET